MNTYQIRAIALASVAGICMLLGTAANAAPTGKIEICHKPGQNNQKILTIAPSGVAGHETHGDYIVEPEVCDGLDSDCESPPVADNDVDCSDGIACTVDSCAGAPGCFSVPDDAQCNDNNANTLDECSVASGGCVNTLIQVCGNGTIEAPEQCDDGNTIDGDGCSASCEVEANCSNGSVKLSLAPGELAMVCDDPTNNTCEQDAESLCPTNWHLCSDLEYNNRNEDWNYDVGPPVVVGEIYCRSFGGAGHFTLGSGVAGVTDLSQDAVKNCQYGSARPDSCGSTYGCNEKQVQALCCAPAPLCGNGVVDTAEEECDDGNSDETDVCLNSCSFRVPANNGLPGLGC